MPHNGDLPARPKFLHPEALAETIQFLQLHAELAAIFPQADLCPVDPAPSNLLAHPAHGSITGLTLDKLNGRTVVGVSLLGENPRFLLPLDFCAVRLGMAFGLPLTLQKTGNGLAYPRFRAASSVRVPQDFEGVRSHGWNVYLLRVLADAEPGHTVRHLDPLAELSAGIGQRIDHHYLGRDALRLGSVEDDRDAGKKARTPKLGRAAFRTAALHYFDRNAGKAGLPITREAYASTLAAAFTLADWRYGRVGTDPEVVRNDPPAAAVAA